jgi:hypothetical protein
MAKGLAACLLAGMVTWTDDPVFKRCEPLHHIARFLRRNETGEGRD